MKSIAEFTMVLLLLFSPPYVRKRKLGLFGHVARLPGDVPANHTPGPAVKLKTVSGHHPTGSVPEVDLPLYLDSSDPPGHGNTGD